MSTEWVRWNPYSAHAEMKRAGFANEEPWTRGIDAALQAKLRDRTYLPSLEEVLRIKNLLDYSDATGDHELLTREYVAALGNHLLRSAEAIRQRTGSPLVTVFEVGAGSGRLTHFLDAYVQEQTKARNLPPMHVIATNESPEAEKARRGESLLPPIPRVSRVDDMDAEEAVAQWQPNVVIASWPVVNGLDELVMNQPSVQELIVLGEAEACPVMFDKSLYDWRPIEGFRKTHLDEARAAQVGRTDEPTRRTKWGSSSTTVSYWRET